MKKRPTLLITSCINPPKSVPFTNLHDSQKRIECTLESIGKWLSSYDLDIVLCDGSNFDFSFLVSKHFPNAKIECIYFKNNEAEVIRLGKGYGEGEIINYALKNSNVLKSADYFIKCTGKYFVNNFDECMQYWNGKLLCRADIFFGLYVNAVNITFTDTRFFIINKDLYISSFSQAYKLVDDNHNRYIEHIFKDIIREKKMTHFLFPIVPIIDGLSGTTGINAQIENPKEWREIQQKNINRAKEISNFVAYTIAS